MKQLTELATPFASVADSLPLVGNEFPWLNALRQQATSQFNIDGLPAKKVEDWKYTSLWSLAQQSFTHDADKFSLDAQQCDQIALLVDAYRLVIVDGEFSQGLSSVDALPAGLSITSLSTSLTNVEHVLGKQVDLAKAGLTALNTMLMNEGVVVTVATDVHIEKPIELLVINSGNTEGLATHLRNVITLERNSKATIIEHYVGLSDDNYFTNVVTEVVLAEKAELNHYKLQQESKNAFHIATLAAKQAANSQWKTNNISLGAKLARNDVHSQLLGEQAHVVMDGLYLVNNDQHIDNHTRIDHGVPNTTSEELYKGVLEDNSHAVFNGKVIVHKDAQKTDANQQNHNLLLSRGCEIDSKPEMEIYADDVKCGHGSTVGQINENQLFFLRARGLDEVTARSLLTYAFAVDVLERIPYEDIRQALSVVIEQRLPRGGK
ncbi:MAG: Fe-S cluster assembly protein SufD [Gammaproteobacteria bacterium]|nr:MAG: Fe-S cluster assembly protein SufD [Gammaproteobacteria bacterium]RKZ96817.1 MAG: Fe-S cluster assembly protein SufD [Gammaproteobacteria bacterium]